MSPEYAEGGWTALGPGQLQRLVGRRAPRDLHTGVFSTVGRWLLKWPGEGIERCSRERPEGAPVGIFEQGCLGPELAVELRTTARQRPEARINGLEGLYLWRRQCPFETAHHHLSPMIEVERQLVGLAGEVGEQSDLLLCWNRKRLEAPAKLPEGSFSVRRILVSFRRGELPLRAALALPEEATQQRPKVLGPLR